MTVPAVDAPIVTSEVSLGGKRYWVDQNTVRERKATQFAPAVRTGNPERSDQQFRSEVTWDDLTGGVGVINMDERQSPDRFSQSSIDTRTKKLLALPPKRNIMNWGGKTGGVMVLPSQVTPYAVNYNGYCYIVNSYDVRRADLLTGNSPTLYYFNSAGSTWVTSGGTLYQFSAPAVGPPVIWKGNLWIPCGSKLYRYNIGTPAFAEVTNASGGASIAAQRLEIFDEDLYILTNTGAVYSTDDNATSVNLTSRGSIDTFAAINGLVVQRNFAGDPTPWIATDQGLLTHDYFNAKFYRSGVQFPDANINNGKGLTVWDGDIWCGKAGNALQVVNGAAVVRGPNTGDGLVSADQGYVSAMDSGLDNVLVAAYTPPASADSTTQYARVLAFNRRGWHTLARASGPSRTDGTTLFTDAFTRADSASSPGNSWSAVAGTWGIVSNTAYCSTSAGANNLMVQNINASDASVYVTLSTTGNGARLVFRCDGTASNYYFIDVLGGVYMVGKMVAGVTTYLAGGTIASSNGDQIWAYYHSGYIRAMVNSTLIAEVQDTSLTSGNYVGLATVATTSPRFDNFTAGTVNKTITFVKYQPSGRPDVAGVLWYNEGSQLRYLRLFDSTDNPEQYVSTDYESSGELLLPRFDAGLAEVQKTAFSVQIRTLDCSATETVTVSYALDDSSSFTTLYKSDGSQSAISSNGVTTLYFDTDQLGTYFYNVRLKITLASGSSTASPKVVFVKITYVRELSVLYAYDFFLDLGRIQPDGRQPIEAIADLRTIVAARKLVKFAFNSGKTEDTKTVLLLNYAGPMAVGPDRSMKAQLALAEV